MKYCRHSLMGTIGRVAVRFLYPFTATVFFGAALILLRYALMGNWGCLVVSLGAFFVTVLMVRLSVICYRLENRMFSITRAGITLTFKKIKEFYTWDQIYEVAIVAYAANAGLQNYDTVICCFLKPRPTNFSKKILRGYFYGAKHTNDFVIIDYSCSIHDAIASSYPGDIHDYRKEQLGLWK